ncbi:type II toxin-antitoxin system RelB/DinJ family antitoxin [Alphaproteobacteria bacterium]|nr:type II toxin-antitoxin system RelB/DinJ family antitoxin [Alphaproteobacteria bacterium]
MARTETIRARVEPALKSEAEAILKKIGLSSSEAMRLFLYQVVQQRGLPFEVKIPNAETIAAIEELEAGKGIRVNSVEELFDDAD